MANTGKPGARSLMRRASGMVAAAGCCLLLGACSQVGSPADLLALQKPSAAEQKAASAETPAAEKTAAANTGVTTGAIKDNRSELHKATEFWGKAFSQNPKDAQTALNYARNLRAMGEKQQAMSVLQQASSFNGTHRGIMSEYGRLALELDQITLAQKILEQADDPAAPDWKTISARGTVMAKQGLYREAIPLYERALELAPNQASVLSNLALAHAMVGSPEKAEPLLKRAVAASNGDERVNQNLALVLGLQGKYDEAKLTAGRDLPPDRASASVDYVKAIVRADAKPLQVATAEKPAADTKAVETKAAKTETKAAKADAKAAKTEKIKGAQTATAGDVPAWSTSVAVVKP
jgi:Flp pilus assembly protein TadD